MKKKILLSITMLFVLFVALVNVNAAQTRLLPLENTLKAKAPGTIPANNSSVKATVSEVFDFSKVKVKAADGTEIPGMEALRKIVIGQLKSGEPSALPTYDASNPTAPETYLNTYFGNNWFTAYCLDSSVGYPDIGAFTSPIFYESFSNDSYSDVIREIVRAAIWNKPGFESLHNKAKSEYGDYYSLETVYFAEGEYDGERDIMKDAIAQSIINDLKAGNEVTIKVSAIRLDDGLTNYTYYVASDAVATALSITNPGYITSDHTKDYVEVKVKLSDVAFDNYIAKDNVPITNFEHALWIVEHSYPTLSIKDALELAGVDETKLDTQIRTLYASEIGTGEGSEAKFNTIKENLVFGTVQYAIWYSVGSDVPYTDREAGVASDKKLGNQMVTKVGTEDFELNKLYSYLVQDRSEYNGYSNAGYYSNKITITAPAKELAETTKDGYIYGPFKASYTAVVESGNKMEIEITNTDKTGITFLDAEKKEITDMKLDNNQMYYIKVSNKANIGNVNYRLKLSGIQTFTPSSNRGRVYYSEQGIPTVQNAMSGGKMTTASIQGEFSLVTNAKTGVENIALLLMVTLVAFTLGYVVLSYKTKPIQLNQ